MAPIEVVPNGTSMENRLRKSVLKPTYEVGLRRKVIITTSRLVHKNGVDVLIRAAAELKRWLPKLILKSRFLALVDEKELKDLAKELKVDDVVQFLVLLSRKKFMTIWRKRIFL